MLKAHEAARFFVPVDEVTANPTDFFKKYQFGIAPLRGIPAN